MAGLLTALTDFLIGCVALIDALPGYLRALLAGLILALLLRFWETRICENEVLYSVSFRKTAFVALLLVPMLVWLFPDSRMVVFVDELPDRSISGSWGWLPILCFWLGGFLFCFYRLIRSYMDSYAALKALPAIAGDDKLLERLAHWQRQLDITRPLTLVTTPTASLHHLPLAARIALPRAALHWPAGNQDVLLIRELCHLKKRHSCWHAFAQFVACSYWPVTWVSKMHRRMLENFQLAADSLAESCYQDPLGYDRALKQIAQRLAPPAALRRKRHPDEEPTRGRVLQRRIRSYRAEVTELLHPDPAPACSYEQLFQARAARERQLRSEPYDKVFWFVGQAVFLALLFTGPTLKQTPPEVEQNYALPFELLWMEHFHRNQERMERQSPALPQDPELNH